MRLAERACPVCKSTDDSRVAVEADYDARALGEFAFASRKLPEFMHFRMVRCPECDVLYASPAPDLEWVRAQYRESAFDSGEESRYAARTHARCLAPVIRRLPDRRAALDVGAGDGAFLRQLLDAGFADVVGVEPALAPVQQAAPEIRARIRSGFFRGEDFAPGTLTLVTCFQTLEHTDDPAGLCAAAHRLLRPGGAFCTVAHNHRAFTARVLGTRSPIYDVEHLQLFSPRSLRALLERAGFAGVTVATVRNDYPLAYWAKLLPLGVRSKRALLSALRVTRVGRIVLPLWAGNLVAVGHKAAD